MPDVTDLPLDEASKVLSSEGIEESPDPADFGEGIVVATDPAAGESLDPRGVSYTLAAIAVTKVLDGDTVVLSTGHRVRLIGVDTPEKGRCGAGRATALVHRLLSGQAVVVRNPKEVEDHDKYGRSLAYLGTETVGDVGYRLLRRGLAVPRYNSTDGFEPHPAEDQYADAANSAKRVTCRPKSRPTPTIPRPVPAAPRWTCSYSPTFDRDWHNDVICTNGVKVDRPYLRAGDSFVTKTEIMNDARAYANQLNSR